MKDKISKGRLKKSKLDKKTHFKTKKDSELLEVALDYTDEDKTTCKICNDPKCRFLVAEMHSRGELVYSIRRELKKTCGIGITDISIDRHLKNHEKNPLVWTGYIKSQFPTEEHRKRYESQFLSRISLVTEMWNKYQVLAELFELLAGKPGEANATAIKGYGVDKTARLASEMRMYLEDMLRLQKERDVIVEVSKTVLYALANSFIERLAGLISDLSTDRREAIGVLLVEEVKKSIDYAKSFGKEKLESMITKVNEEYDKLVKKVE